ncbi:MAG: TRAP transporter substrate-binding protein DctP [Rhizobiaceae bacterium]|nr:TRAP transporter substrate-binding protein DctP [Rhizobiaceae bacterium]
MGWTGLIKTVAAAGLAAGLAAVATVSPASAQETITWKVQSNWLPGNKLYDSVLDLFSRVDKMSQGRLKIELLPAGAVVATNQTLEAVKTGILDGHISYPTLFAGVDPGFAPLGDIPGAYSERYQTLEFMYYYGGVDMLREAYGQFGLHLVGVGTGSWEAIPSKVPLATLDDFKGVKLRTPPGLSSLIWERFGAVPVVMPQTEVFSALEKGVIDAADDGSLSYNFAVGDYDVAKYTLLNSPHSNGVWDFSVNADRWAAVPDDIKLMLEIGMRDIMFQNIVTAARDDEAALKKAAEIGLTVNRLSDEDRARYRKVALEVWDEWAKKSDFAKKVIEAHKAYLTEKGLL